MYFHKEQSLDCKMFTEIVKDQLNLVTNSITGKKIKKISKETSSNKNVTDNITLTRTEKRTISEK